MTLGAETFLTNGCITRRLVIYKSVLDFKVPWQPSPDDLHRSQPPFNDSNLNCLTDIATI